MSLALRNLTVEYRECPLGIDSPKPRISWQLCSSIDDTKQSVYSIIVTDSNGVVWQTDNVYSDCSQQIEYSGAELSMQTRYHVTVFVTDNHENSAQIEGWFETGLMGDENFKAHWIVRGDEGLSEACTVFKKRFLLPAGVKSARLYASALGVYEAGLNGQKIGNMVMAPGWTSYSKRIQYQTYDITGLLESENELSITVAKGWFNGALGFDGQGNHYGEQNAALAQLEIEFENGDRQTLITDESWLCTTGPRRYSEIYHGEIIDLTFSDESESPVKVLERLTSDLVAQECEPVRVTQRLKPLTLLVTPNGETVLDFGQNLVGVVEADLRYPRGTVITLQHAEMLDRDGNFYTTNLRTAKATDTFVCSGVSDVFRPAFTFHGFRYVKVEGFVGTINPDNFTACVLHSDLRITGKFACSHKGLTQLQNNIQWSQRGNFLDIPTDCPQRDERFGWTGDAQVFAATAAFNMQTALFFAKWLRDVAAEQSVQYGVPNTVPNVLGTSLGAAAWGDAATIIPWAMYHAYGDVHILREQYQSMKNWVEYIRLQAGEKALWQSGYQYGDWLALDKEEGSTRTGATDVYLIANAFYAHSTEILAKTAALLGYTQDAEAYGTLYDTIVENFQKEYITQTGRMVSETQTACVLALHFNLAKTGDRARILESLVENISKHNDHLTTGFVGTPYLCQTLTENGHHELAGKIILKRDVPSWLYAVDQGATTIWERWDSMKKDGSFDETGMNSFNHYAYGAIGSWMYEHLAGIQYVLPGYQKNRIAPLAIKGVTWVKASLETPYGRLTSDWKCENKRFILDVEIPANTTALICLPGMGGTTEVGSGNYHFECDTDLELESTRYSMESTMRELLDNPIALSILNQYAPGMTDNPMLSFVMDTTIAGMTALVPPEVAQLFQTVIAALNAAEVET